MMIAKRPKRTLGLQVVDVYFPDAIDAIPLVGDIAVVLQADTAGDETTPFYTSKIDLNKAPDKLLSDMNKTTRYEIRRADERDSLHVDINLNPTHDDVQMYADFFDGYFVLHKDIQPCNQGRLAALRKHRGLALTQVKHESGDVLAAHANVVDLQGDRARLLYAVSCYRQIEDNAYRALISRANRLLHWCEIQHFQKNGFTCYDFGGIGGPGATGKQQQIADFKLGFGGQKCTEYNAIIGNTMLGKTALAARKLVRL
ncbi:MAG: hypothetical protein ACI91V_000607 [Lentimonas sp.]|jgi:hypothetical protein